MATLLFAPSRFGTPIEGNEYYWRQVLLESEVIIEHDVVFDRNAKNKIGTMEDFHRLMRLAEGHPNHDSPTNEYPYMTIFGWANQYTLSQMLNKDIFRHGFVMRRADRCTESEGAGPPVRPKPRSLVSMLPKNTYFAKPLPLP